jgi:hypothetical protein
MKVRRLQAFFYIVGNLLEPNDVESGKSLQNFEI